MGARPAARSKWLAWPRASGRDVRLYADDGEIDETARETFERVAANDAEPHALAPRVEQLLMRAAYHFGAAPVQVVSAWRERASRHGTGEAIDFKLKGVGARQLAAYLRQLPRAGVGIYTNPRTQFVHLDVRDQSYHWVDASPPGVKWHEAQIRDPGAAKRDAAWTPEADLPIYERRPMGRGLASAVRSRLAKRWSHPRRLSLLRPRGSRARALGACA